MTTPAQILPRDTDVDDCPSGVFQVAPNPVDRFGEFASRLLERGLHHEMMRIAFAHHVTFVDVFEGKRTQTIIRARRACWRYLTQVCMFSCAEVGALFALNESTIYRGLHPQIRKRKALLPQARISCASK
jgi:hypothetical protein